MSARDDAWAKALSKIERPPGCRCDVEWIERLDGLPLRVSLYHNVDCPAGMPKTAAQLERLKVDS